MNSEFLAKLKSVTGPDVAWSHTSVEPRRKYIMNRSVYEETMDSYSDHVENDDFLNLTERPQSYSQLRVDVDIKREGEFPTKFYNDQQLTSLIASFQTVISKTVYNAMDDHCTCFVLEKPAYAVKERGKIYIKNGFHLQFPNVFISKKAQTNTIFPKVAKLMDEHPEEYEGLFDKNPSELLDIQACCSNVWLMYGSGKNPKSGKYTVTKIITKNCVDIQLSDFLQTYKLYDIDSQDLEITKDPEFYLPRILSVNPCGRPFQEVKNNILEIIENCQRDRPIGFTLDENGELSEEQINKNITQAATLLNLLADFRSDDRSEWCKIGWILHRISDGAQGAYELFVDFSQRSPRWDETFGEGGCSDLWQGTQYNFGMGTLKFLAKTDDPEGYDKFIQETTKSLLETGEDLSDFDFAEIMKTMVGQENVYSEGKWYNFTGQKWEPLEKGLYLSKMISKELREQYKKVLAENKKQIGLADDPKKALEDHNKMKKLVKDLGNSKFKSGIMRGCEELFWYNKFSQKLNKIPHIFVFQNGTFDFSIKGDDGRPGVFRNTVPDDFSSRCAAVDYEVFDDNHPDMIALQYYLRQVFPDPEIRDFFLDAMSDICIKGNTYKYVLFWTGNGNNSKSVIQKIFEDFMGDYCKKLPTSAVVGKRGNSSGASPEFARIGNDVRAIWIQEPAGTDSFDVGVLKELSGNDTMYARGLFSEGGEMSLDFITIVTCNTIPIIRGDAAVWNRIKMIPFESEFTHDAPLDEDEQFRQKRFPLDIDFTPKTVKFLKPLAYVLVHNKRHLITSYIKIPEKVSKATDGYKMKNNVVLLFQNEYLVAEKTGSVSIPEIYSSFKGWYKDAFSYNAEIPSMIDFKESICKNLKLKIPDFDVINGVRLKTMEDREKAREEKLRVELEEENMVSVSVPVKTTNDDDKGVEETKEDIDSNDDIYDDIENDEEYVVISQSSDAVKFLNPETEQSDDIIQILDSEVDKSASLISLIQKCKPNFQQNKEIPEQTINKSSYSTGRMTRSKRSKK
ncbi:MAG: PriCT-2 domain-containing protein [Colwellia sp.]|nr:PriCT-2 domain-containing protein [Colwellia sp.]